MMKALIGAKLKSTKDNIVGNVKEKLGGGKGGRKSGDTKVMNIVESLDVGVPIRTAYDHWTKYEAFSGFTKGVRSVSQKDEVSSDWKVKVGPSTRGWSATVQEQVPDDRIVWTSEGAKGSTRGCVSFHELAPSLTRIVLVVEYYPSGFFEKTGNLWRAQGRRLRLDFKHFQRHVTLTDEEVEGWRGEVRDGEVVVSHEDALEREEAEREEHEGEEGEERDDRDRDYDYEDEAEDRDEGEDRDEAEGRDEEAEEDEEYDDEEAAPGGTRTTPITRTRTTTSARTGKATRTRSTRRRSGRRQDHGPGSAAEPAEALPCLPWASAPARAVNPVRAGTS